MEVTPAQLPSPVIHTLGELHQYLRSKRGEVSIKPVAEGLHMRFYDWRRGGIVAHEVLVEVTGKSEAAPPEKVRTMADLVGFLAAVEFGHEVMISTGAACLTLTARNKDGETQWGALVPVGKG